MKPLVNLACLSLVVVTPFAVAADCPGTQVTGTNLTAYLGEQLICAYKADSDGSDPMRRWSEMHNGATGGTLGEWGRGPGDSAGSYTADIGSWSVSGDTITYTYTGHGSYERLLFDDNGTYYFCTTDATPQQDAIVQSSLAISAASGSNPCGW